MHNIYISVNNHCLSAEQLDHRGIDVFVRHKEIFPNYQMIYIISVQTRKYKSWTYHDMDSIHQGKLVVHTI